MLFSHAFHGFIYYHYYYDYYKLWRNADARAAASIANIMYRYIRSLISGCWILNSVQARHRVREKGAQWTRNFSHFPFFFFRFFNSMNGRTGSGKYYLRKPVTSQSDATASNTQSFWNYTKLTTTDISLSIIRNTFGAGLAAGRKLIHFEIRDEHFLCQRQQFGDCACAFRCHDECSFVFLHFIQL